MGKSSGAEFIFVTLKNLIGKGNKPVKLKIPAEMPSDDIRRLVDDGLRSGQIESVAELPMDAASQAQRREAMGMEPGFYHGTGADIGKYGGGFDSSSYVSTEPEYASLYARGEGGNVLPLSVSKEGMIDTRTGEHKAWWDEFTGDREWMVNHDSGLPDHNDEGRFTSWLIDTGKIDDLPNSIMVDENNGRVATKVYEPKKIRSTNAKFDPFSADSPNLLASSAPVAVGGLAGLSALQSEDAEAGVVTVFHRTSKAAGDAIRKTGRAHSKEPGFFVSNRKDGQAAGYGDDVVEMQVPENRLVLDDEFPDGEEHFRINPNSMRHDLRQFKVKSPAPVAAASGIIGLGALQSEDAEAAPITNKFGKKVIEAWHGSPHDFDKFDMSKLGTGEGAQAYGHGLYSADSRGVAENYREALSGKLLDSSGKEMDIPYQDWAGTLARDNLFGAKGDIDEAIKATKSAPQWDGQVKVVDTLERWKGEGIKADTGKLYQLEIDATPDELLDWDKPLHQQSEEVKRAVQAIPRRDTSEMSREEIIDHLSSIDKNGTWTDADSINEGLEPLTMEDAREAAADLGLDEYLNTPMDGNTTGSSLVRQLENSFQDNAQAAQFLKDRGIKGIQYDDAMSRGAEGGTKNYVVFDDKLISIAKKYGISLPLATAVVAGTMTPEQAQAGAVLPTIGELVYKGFLKPEHASNLSMVGKAGKKYKRRFASDPEFRAREFSQMPDVVGSVETLQYKGKDFDPRFDPRVENRGPERARIEGSQFHVENRPLVDRPAVRLEDLEGKPFITTMSDRTAAGGQLLGINDVLYRDPVDLRGGRDYMFETQNQGQVWASAPDVVKDLRKKANKLRTDTGKDPLLLPFTMTPSGVDFSTMTAETMVTHAAHVLGKSDVRALNKQLREVIPGYKGVKNPESMAQLYGANGDQRKAVIQILDRDYRNKGGLSVGQARLAVADPEQVNATDLRLKNIGVLDAMGDAIPESGHPSYQAGVPGQGVGVFDEDVSPLDLAPQYAASKGAIDPINPPNRNAMRGLETGSGFGTVGVITDSIIRRVKDRATTAAIAAGGASGAFGAFADEGTASAMPTPIQREEITDPRQMPTLPPRQQPLAGLGSSLFNQQAALSVPSGIGEARPVVNQWAADMADSLDSSGASPIGDNFESSSTYFRNLAYGDKSSKTDKFFAAMEMIDPTNIAEGIGWKASSMYNNYMRDKTARQQQDAPIDERYYQYDNSTY